LINALLAIQLNVFMVILLSIIFGYACYKFDRKERAIRLFFELIVANILILVLEILSVVLNSSHNTSFINAHKLVDMLGFLLAPAVPIFAALYIYKRTNEYIKISRNKFFWLSIPVVLSGILSLGSLHFNWIFHITSENVYERGPLFFISPLTIFFYYLLNLLFLYENRKKLNKEELCILSLLSLITVVMSIFQLKYFVYLTIWNSMAISIVVNYIFILHSQTKIDPLTGLGNRLAYDECLGAFRRKNNPVLAVLNIDLDDFKSINDLYGHHEGDNVLRAFATELKAVFEGNGMAVRVGGDEFMVLMRENRREVLEQLVWQFIGRIDAVNASGSQPYQIKFSYGLTAFDHTYGTVDEMIRYSDRCMYDDKHKKNNKNY
jgi:diguanylate cyclase (GGDEF)-like protein